MNVMGAMAAGFTTEQVLNFILNSFPHVGQQIHAAKAAGKDIQQIMKFLEPMDTKQLKKMDQEIARSSNPLINAGRATKANSAGVQGPKYAMAAGGLALGAAGAYGLSRMGAAVIPEVLPALPEVAQLGAPAARLGLPAPSPRGMPRPPGGSPPMQPQGGMPQGPQGGPMGGVPQGIPSVMPQAPVPQMPTQAAPKINPAELFDTLGIKNHIDNMVSAKNPPEVIGAVINNILHPQQKKYIQTQTQEPLESLIADYVSGMPSQAQMPAQPKIPETNLGKQPNIPEIIPENQPQPNEQTQAPIAQAQPPIELPKQEIPNLKKGDLVETPDGPGKIESKTKENALVKVNGRVRQYKLDELGLGEKTSKVAQSGNPEEQTILKKALKDLTYEKTYTGTPGQQHALKVIDRGINKAAQYIVEGKDWKDLFENLRGTGKLYSKENKKGISLSVAADVLRDIAGIPSHYKLLDDEETQELFNTYQGLTPNIIWNTISLLEPEIQKLEELPINPKGKKKGKEEMSTTDLRRFVSHAVHKLVEKKKDFGDHARMVISAIDAIDLFDFKSREKFENMPDDELNELLSNVRDEDIARYRPESQKSKRENKPEPEKPKEISKDRQIMKEIMDLKEKSKKTRSSIKKHEIENEIKIKAKSLSPESPLSKEFGKADITKKGLKSQKEFILEKLDEALENQPDTNYITIDVPGDGIFKINNEKRALEKFRKNIKKSWPKESMAVARK